ncbi:MAG TPA: glycosyl transferase family 1 [Planctomycetaceae bacterium]|nr:glycosyl transferase family 1 [Planctomycetaceae bacterium]
MKKLLYYAPFSYGGLLNYAQEQADAIARHGVDVTVLCAPEFTKRPEDKYNLLPTLVDNRPIKRQIRPLRSIRHVRITLRNLHRLRREIVEGGYTHVMFASYGEYFSPIWARWLRALTRKGVTFAAVVQEPVRDFRVGPIWWHRLSIWNAYSFLSVAFVHDSVQLETCGPVANMKTIVIPYGPHRFPDATQVREETRGLLGVPENAQLLLSFGHIRDNKNLDYAIRALTELPNVWLLVAGARNASSQKPPEHYMELARSQGVSDRCIWRIDYISEEEAANLFTACDLVLLTYSSSFRSASGVLHVAARYRKHSIVSSGQGSLQNVLQVYQIGIGIPPDKPDEVVSGIKRWIENAPTPDWERYFEENSWDRNAEIVVNCLRSH